ncbi:MAG TPA: universal stress protein [Dehalococcoidia bacterium]|nr:universal stress protein [Dehalococcoidia bacterium]
MWKKILVPLDGSDLAELALPYAEELATAFKSELILLYVGESSEEQYLNMHRLYLEKMAVQTKKAVERVSPVVISGKPSEAIVKYTEKNDIRLIVMASHGHSSIIPWAKGGIASKVIEGVGVPLLLIKETKRRKTKEKHLISRILLPLDGSEAGEAAITRVKELKSRLEAEVILLEVVSEGRHLHTVGGLDYILYPETELETFKAEARTYLEKVYKRLYRGKGELSVEIKTGEVAKEILNFAKQKSVSLIAISSHGHSGMTKWVFGSTAQKIISDSPIPVLVVRAPAGAA